MTIENKKSKRDLVLGEKRNSRKTIISAVAVIILLALGGYLIFSRGHRNPE